MAKTQKTNPAKPGFAVLEEPSVDVTYFDDGRVLFFLEDGAQGAVVGFPTRKSYSALRERLLAIPAPETGDTKTSNRPVGQKKGEEN